MSPAPVAIVGMSCRLSGDVATPDDLWIMMSRCRDGWTTVPSDRFSTDAYYHPNPQKNGCFNAKGGYYMGRDLSKFDAPFFQISKLEAMAMDPQQRQLLECTYEALENAGLSKESIAGSKMGVFVGGTSSDYRMGNLRDLNQVPMFDATGNHQSIQAGRISYYFDLHGPCSTVDTACSSSLYALHLAVQSIRSGESESAVVAGCSLHMQPDDMVSMSMLGIFNEHGRTFAFDHRAESGFARGEGVGCLILKSLDQAVKDNDRIRSVIVNTGTNHDGKTIGLSTPSGDAQERLIREVYAQAGIEPEHTGFIEAHGTGTKVGDPVEAGAIYRVFGVGRTKRSPLYMGSVKTNVGHLENASGIISIIKASLMLERGFILPNVNFEKPNAEIPLEDWNIRIPVNIQPWPRDKRFISVNNFGFGGSNAHAVLERPPMSLLDLPQEPKAESHKLFVFCANNDLAVRRVASQVTIYIEQHPEIFQRRLLRDIAYTFGERRSHLPCRIAVTAASCDELAKSLNGATTITRRAATTPKLAFIYTGQGAQWPRMGQELMEIYPVFADTLRDAAKCLERLGAEFNLLSELAKSKEVSNMSHAHISQPLCTAVQLALTSLLLSWGVNPAAVLGHSSGEIAAAFAAGLLDLDDAIAVAYHRGQVSASLKVKHPELRGAMLAVGAGAVEVTNVIEYLGLNDLTIACENSFRSVTVSGDEGAVDLMARELDRRGLFNRKLRVDVAYHSSHMTLVAGDYATAIKGISTRPIGNDVVFFSSLHGKRRDARSLTPSYWVENLTSPVLFSTAFQELCAECKPDIVVEVGAHSALEGPIREVLTGISQGAISKVKYFPCLVRNRHSGVTMLNMAGNLFTNGHTLNLGAINQTTEGLRRPALIADFPPYPWSDTKYWFDTRTNKQHRLKPLPRHDLLGTLDDACSDAEPIWRNVISTDDVPWLKDHLMQSLITFPLAGYLCMAVEAAFQRAQLRGISRDRIAGFRLREVQATKAFILDDGTPYETVVSVRAHADGTRTDSNAWDEFRISSWTSRRGWIEHCRGLIIVKKQSAANPVSNRRQQDAHSCRLETNDLGQAVSLRNFYAELDAHGARYGSAFTLRTNGDLQIGHGYSSCAIAVPDTAAVMPASHETPSVLPTALMDLIFQLTHAILGAGRGGMPTLFMPSAIRDIVVTASVPNRPGEQVLAVARGFPDPAIIGPVDFSIDAWLKSDNDPDPAIRIAGFRMTPVRDDAQQGQIRRPLCYEVQWQPVVANKGWANIGHGPVASAEAHQCVANETEVIDGSDCCMGPSNALVHHLRQPEICTNNQQSRIGTESNGEDNYHKRDGKTIPDTNPVDAMDIYQRQESGHYRRNDDTQTPEKAAGHEKTVETSANSRNHSISPVPSGIGSDSITLITNRDLSDPLITALSKLVELHSGRKPTISSLYNFVPSPVVRYVCLAELDAPLLVEMGPEDFKRLRNLVLTCSSLLWVTAGSYRFADTPENNISQGLLRTIRSETAQVAASLELDINSKLDVAGRAKLILDAFTLSLNTSEDGLTPDYEFAEENGQLVVPRIVGKDEMSRKLFHETHPAVPYLQPFAQPGRRLKAVVGTLGALNSMYWQDEDEYPLDDNEIEIRIAATGMNFKDVVVAMGEVVSPYIGVECSGTISRLGSKVDTLTAGDRVCAMSLGAYGTFTRCAATSAAPIPEGMAFERAASIPVAFSTAYYGMVEIARIKPGEKVLIHAAAGGVGQAAIQLAQIFGAEIYATVGSAKKKQLLIDTYSISEERIFYSRSTDFGLAIRAITGGRGVDIAINCLAGDLLRETWECLAPFGRFVEIGKRDITSNMRLEMAKFEQSCTFSSVDLTLLAVERPKIMGRVLTAVMDLFRTNTIRFIHPLSIVGVSEVEAALRELQNGTSSGKIVVSHLLPNQLVKVTHPPRSTGLLRKYATYVIIGGTGGIGRSMARRMVHRGARHVVLLSRKGNITAEIEQLIRESAELGASIYIKQCDASDDGQVNSLVIDLGTTVPPVCGIIHAAMVTKDVLFENMTLEDYNSVTRPKIRGARNFHNALAKQPLDFFLVLSSISGIVGNKGQAAYAAANTYLDAFVAHRRRCGLPAVALNLPAIEDVGYLAENDIKRLQVARSIPGCAMNERELLALVEAAIEGEVNNVCGDQCITGLGMTDPSSLPFYASDSKFSVLRAEALARQPEITGSAGSNDTAISQKLQRASSAEEAQIIVSVGLRDKLGAILMLPAELTAAQQATTPITAFGLDSLSAIELRNWIGRELHAHLQVLELLTSGLLWDLAGLVLRKTKLVGVWT